jgi:hypothetical protein
MYTRPETRMDQKLMPMDHALILRNAGHAAELPRLVGYPFLIDGQTCTREEFALIAELCDPALPLL